MLACLLISLCLVKDGVGAVRDEAERDSKTMTASDGAGGDTPKLIFDKGVLVGVDKQHIDYTKPGRT